MDYRSSVETILTFHNVKGEDSNYLRDQTKIDVDIVTTGQ